MRSTAPAAMLRCTCACSSSRRSPRAIGPTVVSRASGSPTFNPAAALQKSSANRSATEASTMKRLAEIQLWPLLEKRALTAVVAASPMSASAKTMNGSEPPSSSTCFLSARPACDATSLPTAVEPVRVTAAIRSSSIRPATAPESMSTVLTKPAGAPASMKTSCRASAQAGTLLACLSTAPLPAARAGAAKRMNCQKG